MFAYLFVYLCTFGLQFQLSEAKEGLNAAARLGEQLDKKSEIIAGLKEEGKDHLYTCSVNLNPLCLLSSDNQSET